MNELRDKACRAFYAIKRQCPIEIPTKICLKILESVIEPVALILHVHRHTTNNACRAKLSKYPLIIKIHKRAIKFWKHLKLSDPQSYHYKSLQYQEMSKESKPFPQLIQRTNICWCSESQHPNQSDYCTNQTELHHSLANPNSTAE